MAIKATISSGAGIKASVSTKQIVLSPELQTVWDVSDNTEKNTFVDANDAEIATYFNNQLIFLSPDASAAVINIESNGGTLTSEEKYYVGVWVDRMVANGDWALMIDLAYAGFSDDSCKLTKWKTGSLMTNNGATLTGKVYSFDGINDTISTGLIPSSSLSLNNFSVGIYIDRNIDKVDGATITYLDSTTGADRLTFNQQILSIRLRLFAASDNDYDISNQPYGYREKGLYSLTRIDSANTNVYVNGISDGSRAGASTALPTASITIGGNNSGTSFVETDMAMFFATAAIGFDQADFYEGFEDFRTSLHPEILYNIPAPTGQTTIYRTGDDADIEQSLFTHFRKAMAHWNGVAPKLVDFMTLSDATPNAFGGTERFTDIDNLQVYGDDYVIDHYTGLGWYKDRLGTGSKSWDESIDYSLASIDASFEDWFLPTRHQLLSLTNAEGFSDLNYAPFLNNTLFWGSTTQNISTTAFLLRPTWNTTMGVGKTTVSSVIYITSCRKHY